MPPVIEIRNLGKQYKLATSQPYISLREILAGSVKNIFGTGKKKKEKFWALQDIDLDIQPGEKVGIIGRNGAGKSTLLKIISRITPPTKGHATLRGRVGSLLEVGTGFHPELSGRENIYLNGSILGLKKAAIHKQFDAIVDFSGVEKFIDTPLKHYSSGMQMRLAFSVAAYLESEILLIDEVLAVGDAAFQKKCLGKMNEVSEDGRTILFVSHNLGAVQALCNKAIYLSDGKVQSFDATNSVVERYLKDIPSVAANSKSYGNGNAAIISCRLLANSNVVTETLLGYPLTIEIQYRANDNLQNVEVAFNIRNIYGEIITHSTTLDKQMELRAVKNEVITMQASLHSLNMTPGPYSLDIFVLNNGDICNAIIDQLEFNVLNSDKSLRPDGFPSHVKTFTETTWKTDRHESI
ncbi:MAG TPA: ABC transporter ATP-binding protein [Chitinophagaceae bacterium]|jgi:lipopolysaccharide transport system ATP-binding protein|nr:ABC transporter ATP-binding protein [Chitinophagaceae bacterium]